MTIKKIVLEQEKQGNIVVLNQDGLHATNLEAFIEQDVEGILYDLNRNEAVILTFIDDKKWVNDYAVAKTIRALKQKIVDVTKEYHNFAKERKIEIDELQKNYDTLETEFLNLNK